MTFRAVLLSSIYALSIGITLFGQQRPNESSSANNLKTHSLKLFGNWRFRAEAWDWFQPTAGENANAFAHSLLRVGLSQTRGRFEWLVEGAQDAIPGLPPDAIAPGNQGQLGLGGTYYVANGNKRNVASGFLKQGYLGIHFARKDKLTLGRFGFSDGIEVAPTDPRLAEIANTRIAQRIIGEFNFSAVMRSIDGAHLSVDAGKSNFTFVAVRPTEGAFQVDAMGELDVDLFYGAYTLPIELHTGSGELRIFGIGYVDQRGGVVKTDNRPLAARLQP